MRTGVIAVVMWLATAGLAGAQEAKPDTKPATEITAEQRTKADMLQTQLRLRAEQKRRAAAEQRVAELETVLLSGEAERLEKEMVATLGGQPGATLDWSTYKLQPKATPSAAPAR